MRGFWGVFRELLFPLLLTLMVLSSLFLLEHLRRVVLLIVNHGLNTRHAASLLMWLLPEALTITLPLAVVGAVFVTVVRQSTDLEVLAWRSAGASLWRYAQPFFALALLATLVEGLLTLWIVPLANQRQQQLQLLLVQQGMAQLQPGILNQDFGEQLIRVEKRTEDGFEGIFIAPRKMEANAPLITARSGKIIVNRETSTMRFALQEGEILVPGEDPAELTSTTYRRLDFALAYAPMGSVRIKHIAARPTMALWAALGEEQIATVAAIELYRRLLLPLSCLALSMGSLSLALVDPRSGRSAGYLRSILLVLVYYLLWTALKDLVYGGAPGWVLLLPAVCVGAYGAWRLNRAQYPLRR